MNATATQSSFDFDRINSVYTLTLHFKNALTDFATGQPKTRRNKEGHEVLKKDQIYYLKKVEDLDYAKGRSELFRMFYLINSHRKTESNSIESFAIYENISKGGTIKGVDNKDGWICSCWYNYEHKVYKKIFNRKLSEESKKFWNEKIQIIEDKQSPAHKAVRKELNMDDL